MSSGRQWQYRVEFLIVNATSWLAYAPAGGAKGYEQSNRVWYCELGLSCAELPIRFGALSGRSAFLLAESSLSVRRNLIVLGPPQHTTVPFNYSYATPRFGSLS